MEVYMNVYLRAVVFVCIITNALYGGSLRAIGPAQRSMASMITDTVNQRIIMYGGQDYGITGQCYDEIWSFNPASEAWTEITVSPPTPPPRRNPALAYDPATNQMFMFGGRTAYTFFNDLWVLDLTPGSEHWTQLTPTGTPPGPRTEITGIYDHIANRIMYFGGDQPSGIRTNETWQLDLNTMAWSMLTPSGPVPLARSAYGAVYDPTQHRMIVFSGCASPILPDVWALNLTYGSETWQQLYPTGPTPQGRGQPFCAYDETQHAMIFGFGYDYPGYIDLLSDVWALDLTTVTWQQVVPTGTVAPRRGSCGSYSPQNGLIYIHGGDAGIALSTTYALYTDPVGIEEIASQPITEQEALRVSSNPVVLPCKIKAFLQKPGEICVNIIDNSGRVVRTIIEPVETAGNHVLNWDGLDQNDRRVSAGTYFIQLSIDGIPVTKKVVLIE
jgi:hypothetical protein